MVCVSVIIPIYNVEKYIEKCLNSLKEQTLSNIEFICVNDSSTDASGMIAERFAEHDSRFRVVHLESNRGTLQARKAGVLAADSEYMMFLDGDDWLEEEACSRLYEEAKALNVDILQYGTHVISAASVSDEMLHWVENFLKPYEKRLEGKDILHACFVEGRFDFNITDKIWKTALCKKVFSKLEDSRMVAAEDQYAFFILAYYAESYQGISKAEYYNYNVGIGITGSDILDLERFERRCSGVRAAEAVKRFLRNQKIQAEYKEEYRAFENRLLWDCVACWHDKLSEADSGVGYDILLKYWEPEKVVSAIARTYFEEKEGIIERVKNTEIGLKKRAALYFRYLEDPDKGKFIKKQIAMIQKLGFAICLFIDEDTNIWKDEETWEIPLIKLPSSANANWDEYKNRADVLAKEIREKNIQNLFYATPDSHIAWLDILLLKSLSVHMIHLSREKEPNIEYENMQAKYEELLSEYNSVLNSKTYKVGGFLMKGPKEIRKLFLRKWKKREE